MIIAPSFADIFYNNCFKNGLLPVILTEDEVEFLFEELYETTGFSLSVDLLKLEVVMESEQTFNFHIDEFSRDCLIKGLDEIGLTKEPACIHGYSERLSDEVGICPPRRQYRP